MPQPSVVFSLILLLCNSIDRVFYVVVVVTGNRTLIKIMGTLLERYGKGEDLSAAPSDATSVFPGLPCVAQFTEDGMWYRARVVKFVEEDKVEVMLVNCSQSPYLLRSLNAQRETQENWK